VNLAIGMVRLIAAEPTLLPTAPADDWAAKIEQRRLGEVHSCLRCGQRARCAYIAHTNLGPRWLDLCPPCDLTLRRALDEDAKAEQVWPA
jgi:hypothetical protein